MRKLFFCLALILFMQAVFARTILSEHTENNFRVVWYDCKFDLTAQSCFVDVQNLNPSTARDFYLSFILSDTSYDRNSFVSQATIKEWKALPTIIPTYSTQNISVTKTCYNLNNQTNTSIPYDCSYSYIETYQNGSIIQNIISWKETKSNMIKFFSLDKAYYGDITLPKYASKSKTDDFGVVETVNGTKTFFVEWTTKVGETSGGWGSSGKFAVIDDYTGIEYHPWWNTSWVSRKPITINGSSSVLTDYQVKIELNWTSGMNATFTDLRFTDNSTNGVSLPFWIENYTASTNATVWIKTNLSTGNNTVYVYYSNPAALSASNGTNTFILFDDFSSGAIDTTKWTTGGTGIKTITNGWLVTKGTNADWNTGIIATLNQTRNISVNWLAKNNNSLQIAAFVGWGNIPRNAGDLFGFYYYRDVTPGTFWVAAYNTYTSTPTLNQNMSEKKFRLDINDTTISYFIDNYNYRNYTNTTLTNKAFQVSNLNQTLLIDNVFIRKYTSPEPVVLSTGAEEGQVSTPPSIQIQSPANTTYNISVISLNFTASDNVGISQCFYELNGASNVSITNCLNTTISPSDGSKWIKIWANDTDNNWNSTPLVYFVKDTTPPNITLVNLSSNITNDNTPTFTGNTTDAISAITSVGYRLNGGSWQAATATDGAFNSPFENYTLTTSTLSDGNYLIEVRSWDALGNIVTSYPSFNFTVDTTLPTVNIQLPANTTYGTISRTLNFTAGDINGISSCKYELNGAANVSLAGCANTSFTAVGGGNTIRVYVNDTANNWNSSTVSFTIDSIPPSINIQFPANTTYNSVSRTLNYTTSDNNGVSQCKYELNGGANVSLVTCQNTTFTANEGSNSIKVWANDSYNNWNVSATTYFTIDTIPPSINIQLPANNTWYTSLSRTLNYTTYDIGGVSQCKQELNGINTTLATCQNNSFTAIEGTNNIAVWANDSMNNWNRSSITIFFTDTIPPTINIQQPTQSIWYTTTNRTLNFTAWDLNGVSQCKYELNGVNTTIGTCVNTTFTAVQGSNTVAVWANDTKGNWNKSATITFNVDSILPSINIQSPANTTYLYSNISLNYTTSDLNGLSTCKYELNGVNTTIGVCVNTSFNAVIGGNSIKVWANDTSNNWNVSATVYFTLNNTLLNITIQSPTNITYNTATISLNFTAGGINPVSTCIYELDGVNTTITGCQNTSISITESYQYLENATTHYSESCTTLDPTFSGWFNTWWGDGCSRWGLSLDTIGEVNYTINPLSNPTIWKVKTYSLDAQYLTVTQYISNNLFRGRIVSNFSNNSVELYAWNISNWKLLSSIADSGSFFSEEAINQTIPLVGAHTLKVWANDTANNWGVSSTVSFTVDTTLPSATIQLPVNATYNKLNNSVTLNFTTSDNFGVSQCKYELDGVNTSLPTCSNTTLTLTDGSHRIKVWVNDTANNWNSTPLVYFVSDFTEPTINIQSPSNSTYTISTVALNFTIGESVGLSTCIYELDGVNTTISCNANTTITGLSHGGHSIKIWANDTAGNMNNSATISFNNDIVLYVYVYDETTPTQNVTFNLTLSNSTASKTANNQGYYTGNFTADPRGSLTLTLSAAGYNSRTFYTTWDGTAKVNYTAYLLTGTNQYTFYIKNANSVAIEGAVVTIKRSINNVLQTVGEATTDTAGTVLFTLTPNIVYTVQVVASGYNTHTGTILPTQASYTYTITLSSSTSLPNFQQVWNGIRYSYQPAFTILKNAVNTFNFTIYSIVDGLTSYGMNISVNGTVVSSQTGNTSTGGSISATVDLRNYTTEAGYARLWFTKTGMPTQVIQPDKNFNVYTNPTSNISASAIAINFGNTAGITEQTKFMISVITAIIMMAVTAGFGAGRNGSAIIGLLVFGAFVWVGWVPALYLTFGILFVFAILVIKGAY